MSLTNIFIIHITRGGCLTFKYKSLVIIINNPRVNEVQSVIMKNCIISAEAFKRKSDVMYEYTTTLEIITSKTSI